MKMNGTIFWMYAEKVAEITQNRQKSFIFVVVLKQRKQLKGISTNY